MEDFALRYSPYLKELKKRILFTVFAWVGATVFGFIFYEQIIKILIGSLSLEGVNIVFTSPFQFINLAISCGISTGLVIVFPLIIYQLISFLRPALRQREYKMIMSFLPFAIMLFAAGFMFGAFIMRWQIEIFLDRSKALGIGNFLDISSLLSTVVWTSTLMGVGFQFPIILLALLRLGVIKTSQLAKKRVWVYLFSVVFAMLLPPDSILADIVLSMPLIILFETTLIINKLLEKMRKHG